MQFKCPKCSANLRAKASLSGKQIKCPKCSQTIQLPTVAPVLATVVEERGEADPFGDLPTPNYQPQPATPSSRKSNQMWAWVAIAAGVGVACLGLLGMALGALFFWGSSASTVPTAVTSTQKPPAQAATGRGNQSSPAQFAYRPVDVSRMPLGPRAIPGHAVDLFETQLIAAPGRELPAGRTEIRIYRPRATSSDRKMPCILVGPAGTNLLHGSQLGLGEQNDYHDEALPYADAGMIVVCYSLDGWMEMDNYDNEQAMLDALPAYFSEFYAAGAGTANARVALDYALEHFPEIDNNLIFAAGHSSAGTLALQLATAEPRLAGALAYAPVTNLQKQLGELQQFPSVVRKFTGLTEYISLCSPHSLTPGCDLFVFAAKNDQIESFSNIRFYSSMIRGRMMANQCTIKFESVATGGHYQSMIDEGIPRGIRWINDQVARIRNR